MAKVTIETIANLQNESSVIEKLNANFVALAAAIENTLSRDGTAPNVMDADLDINEQRILNLPAPVTDTEPARHGDLQQYVDAAEAAQEAAETAQQGAETAETNAEAHEDGAEAAQQAAEAALATFQGIWLGTFEEDPVGSFQDGDIYFNSVTDALRVYSNGEFVEGYIVPDDFTEDAPADGTAYRRIDNSWVGDPIQDDAPSDGNQYARQDGAWEQVVGGGGGGKVWQTPDTTNTTSATGRATKGRRFTPLEEGTIATVWAYAEYISGGTYRAGVALLDSSNVVQSVSESADFVAPSTVTEGKLFDLVTPVTVPAGTRCFVYLTRRDQGDSYALPVSSSGTALYAVPTAAVASIWASVESDAVAVSETIIDGTGNGMTGFSWENS